MNMHVRTNLQTTVMPKSILHLQQVGDLMKNHGADDDLIQKFQDLFARKLATKLIILGLDHHGFIREEINLWFDPVDPDATVSLDMGEGVSVFHALDPAFAAIVAYGVDRFRRLGLTTSYWFTWAEDVTNEQRIAVAHQHGFTTGGTMPAYAPGFGPRTYLAFSPGKDRTTHYAASLSKPLT